MIACPECAAEYLPGTLFCEQCGAAIHPAAQAHVARTAAARPAEGVAAPLLRRRPEAVPPPPAHTDLPALRVAIAHAQRELTVRAALIRVGRADPDADFQPELDLTPFEGQERGVSRRHAAIQWAEGGFVIIDQHSSNGTWLEGVRLVAGYAYQLPPNANVRFGDLLVQLAATD